MDILLAALASQIDHANCPNSRWQRLPLRRDVPRTLCCLLLCAIVLVACVPAEILALALKPHATWWTLRH